MEAKLEAAKVLLMEAKLEKEEGLLVVHVAEATMAMAAVMYTPDWSRRRYY